MTNREQLKQILMSDCPYGVPPRACKLFKPRRLQPETRRLLCELYIESEISKYLMIHQMCEKEQQNGKL